MCSYNNYQPRRETEERLYKQKAGGVLSARRGQKKLDRSWKWSRDWLIAAEGSMSRSRELRAHCRAAKWFGNI